MRESRSLAVVRHAIEGCTLLIGSFVRREDDAILVTHPGAPGAVVCDVLHGVDTKLLSASSGEVPVLLAVPADGAAPILVGVIATGQSARTNPGLGKEAQAAEVVVDGDRLIFEARRELVLRCGPSEIILRRDGKVIVRGRDVTSRASGTNKLKGANVSIN